MMLTRRPSTPLRRLAMTALIACSSSLVWGASKGPDSGGYFATDEIMSSFVDISGASGGTTVLSGADDGTAALTLPFSFSFYGQPYAVACVSTNGALYFVPSPAACTGFESDFANVDVSAAPVPNDRPALLPYWTDLTFAVGGAGAVYYQTVGSAPSRRFVVQWENAYVQGSTNPVTFQAILTEGSPRVVFQYKTVTLGAGDPARQGAHATVGIRNAGSPINGQSLQWSFNAPVLTDGTALAFTTGAADTQGPVVTATAPATLTPGRGGRATRVRILGSITDANSGVASARYDVTDEYGTVQPTGPVKLDANGAYILYIPLVATVLPTDLDGRTYTIVIRAWDNAGNVSTATVVVVAPH
jgi:Big-like domain-containing protein